MDVDWVLRPVNEQIAKLKMSVARYPSVIYPSEVPARRAIIQVVGKRVELALEDDWGGRAPGTRIVVIGGAGGIDEAMRGDQFQQLIAQDQLVQPSPARSSDLG